MTKADLEQRTKAFAVSVIRFLDNLPKRKAVGVIATQLARSATSIGANYREANRAESRRDFVHKIAIIEKEAAESLYWIELFEELMIGNPTERRQLACECDQLLAIFTRIGKTTKERTPNSAFRIPHSEFSE